jgi:hypothetical protein
MPGRAVVAAGRGGPASGLASRLTRLVLGPWHSGAVSTMQGRAGARGGGLAGSNSSINIKHSARFDQPAQPQACGLAKLKFDAFKCELRLTWGIERGYI